MHWVMLEDICSECARPCRWHITHTAWMTGVTHGFDATFGADAATLAGMNRPGWYVATRHPRIS